MTLRGDGPHPRRATRHSLFRLIVASLLLSTAGAASAQTAKEHDQHHPANAPATTAAPAQSGTPGMPVAPASQGGSNQQGTASGQTCCGGAPPPSPLFPAMMAMPELTPARRLELERQAGERLVAGTAMMSDAFQRLASATQSQDAAAMQDANALVREGLAQFESGVALRGALAQDRAPHDVALEWFRKEMNLVPLTTSPAPHGLFGLSWFHYIVMSILSVFGAWMIATYFRKMRRAEALIARLTGGRVSGGAPAAISPTAESAPPVNAAVAPSKSNSWNGLLRVARIFQETATVKTFRLIDPLFGKLPFSYLPGQFLTVTVSVNGDAIKRSYSISSSPTERDYCEITVKRDELGVVSRFLHDQVH